jgi:hypothetical protein
LEKTTAAVWPDAQLEKQMIEDADLVAVDHPPKDESALSNVACHVRALMSRIRELEQELTKRVKA